MRKYRKLYIIIVVAYAALLVVSRIYSVSSFLVDIVYLFSWIVLLFLEIRKQYHVKKNDKKEEIDYFPIILIFLRSWKVQRGIIQTCKNRIFLIWF